MMIESSNIANISYGQRLDCLKKGTLTKNNNVFTQVVCQIHVSLKENGVG